MASLKKYETLSISVIMVEQDIITTSAGGFGGGDPVDDDGSRSYSLSRMNPLDRPLGIFKRD